MPTPALPQNPIKPTGGGGGGGSVGQATPWWQIPGPNGGGAASYANSVNSAPPGYKFDPVENKYVRTASSVGADQGAAINGLTGALAAPGSGYNLFGGAGGGSSSSGFGTGYGVSGGSPYTPPNVSMGGGGGGAWITPGGTPAHVDTAGSMANVKAIQAPDMTAANAAAFGRAKDQVGLESRGAITGLAGAMAGRGISGSGVEGRGQMGVVNQGQQQLGDVSRQTAINDANLAETNALAGYQGDITQRGQNIENANAQTGFNVTQRGQDISAQQAAEQALVAQRGQDVGLRGQEYQGGIAQRGQDIQNFLGQGQLGLGYGDLALRRQQAALTGLGSLAGLTAGNSTATY